MYIITGSDSQYIGTTGRYWSMQTTLRMSSKLGSEGTISKNGGRYSSMNPDVTVRRHISHNTRPWKIFVLAHVV